MDVNTLIRNRRSVFTSQFSGEKIDDNFVEEILENGNWAPNHYHTEPWRFIVFSDEGKATLMSELARLYKNHSGDSFNEAKYQKYEARVNQISHAVCLVLNKSNKPNLPVREEVAAVACAAQNILLSVAAQPHLGAYWSTGSLVYLEEFAEFLELEENQECLGIIYLGVKKEGGIEPQSSRKPISMKTKWITK